MVQGLSKFRERIVGKNADRKFAPCHQGLHQRCPDFWGDEFECFCNCHNAKRGWEGFDGSEEKPAYFDGGDPDCKVSDPDLLSQEDWEKIYVAAPAAKEDEGVTLPTTPLNDGIYIYTATKTELPQLGCDACPDSKRHPTVVVFAVRNGMTLKETKLCRDHAYRSVSSRLIKLYLEDFKAGVYEAKINTQGMTLPPGV